MKKVTLLLIALSLLVGAFVVSVATGDATVSPRDLVPTLLGYGDELNTMILFDFRLPRILVAMMAGAALAVCGAILQSVTKNPLADPGIVGINAGAGLFVVIYLLIFKEATGNVLYALPFFALIGGLLTASIIYLFSIERGAGINPTRLLLVGIGMSAALYGATLVLTMRFQQEQYDFIANWMAGRIWGDTWPFVAALVPWLLVLIPYVWAKGPTLDLFKLHEHSTTSIGVRVNRERIVLLLVAVALASAAVAVSGSIAFVGMMAPHIARRLIGPIHRWSIPMTALIGALLLLVADTLGRSVFDVVGIPAGVVVAILGAPYFMYLMARTN